MTDVPAPEEPLFFHRILKDKVWGGGPLENKLGVRSESDDPLGETWELSDYPGEETRVRGGGCDGWSLRDLMQHHSERLLGRSRPTHDGRFPLLVKFIQAEDDLSVQVHPPDGPKSPTGVGKTEAWYILDTATDGKVVCGLREGTNAAGFTPDADSAAVQQHLYSLPVRRGDCVFVPAGMVHAILGGVTLCEVQQTSDVTYRLYDWDRMGLDGKPREVHVEQALDVIDYDLGPGVTVRGTGGQSSLAKCDYFELVSHQLHNAIELDPAGYARTLSIVAGSGQIESVHGDYPTRPLSFGDVALLPGSLSAVRITPGADGLEILEGVAL